MTPKPMPPHAASVVQRRDDEPIEILTMPLATPAAPKATATIGCSYNISAIVPTTMPKTARHCVTRLDISSRCGGACCSASRAAASSSRSATTEGSDSLRAAENTGGGAATGGANIRAGRPAASRRAAWRGVAYGKHMWRSLSRIGGLRSRRGSRRRRCNGAPRRRRKRALQRIWRRRRLLRSMPRRARNGHRHFECRAALRAFHRSALCALVGPNVRAAREA